MTVDRAPERYPAELRQHRPKGDAGAPARVRVRASDPGLRSLIIQRLTAPGDLEIAEDGIRPDATVEVEDSKPALTAKETQVLAALAEGMANKQIAASLGISLHTVKFHLEGIYRKIGAVNRADAVREGIRRGLVAI